MRTYKAIIVSSKGVHIRKRMQCGVFSILLDTQVY